MLNEHTCRKWNLNVCGYFDHISVPSEFKTSLSLTKVHAWRVQPSVAPVYSNYDILLTSLVDNLVWCRQCLLVLRLPYHKVLEFTVVIVTDCINARRRVISSVSDSPPSNTNKAIHSLQLTYIIMRFSKPFGHVCTFRLYMYMYTEQFVFVLAGRTEHVLHEQIHLSERPRATASHRHAHQSLSAHRWAIPLVVWRWKKVMRGCHLENTYTCT